LIPGKDAAILYDTGFGIGDLKSMVESLTDLPIIVVNSHNHGDHTLGNPQFPKVHIHELDAPFLSRMMEMPLREVPAEDVREYKYVQEDMVQPAKYEVETFKDGHIFDLGGGYEFEVFHLPGHSPGGIALLDKKRRVLFSGDALVWTPILIMSRPGMPITPYHTVEKFREGLTRLISRMDAFDTIYPGHSRQGLSTQLVTDMAACCDELLAGDTTVHYQIMGTGSNVHVHGMGKIAFTEDRIHVK
jgi:glyoxylase-like metal-dependent hydrolase (beta-lactamase superfamily II)